MKRSPLKPRRHGLRRRGARAEREAEALAQFRLGLFERAMGRCERCKLPAHPAYKPSWLHPHHRLPRARGGTHELSNGAALCGKCHRFIHDHAVDDWREWTVETKPRRK